MGKFNSKISAEFHPPKKWILERALSYQNENIEINALQDVGVKVPANRVTCKKGFVTDLASVPRAIWWLISPWDIARAAIIHDLLYLRIRQYRAENEDVNDPNVVMRDCSIFNNSSIRASAKLKYKPKIVDGNPVKVDNVLYRFRYEMLDED